MAGGRGGGGGGLRGYASRGLVGLEGLFSTPHLLAGVRYLLSDR